jgi:hypothetical protein
LVVDKSAECRPNKNRRRVGCILKKEVVEKGISNARIHNILDAINDVVQESDTTTWQEDVSVSFKKGDNIFYRTC